MTNRERDIFRLVVEGKTNAEIAGLLFISPKRVDNHRTRVMEKLGLRTTTELVRYAAKHKLLNCASEVFPSSKLRGFPHCLAPRASPIVTRENP